MSSSPASEVGPTQDHKEAEAAVALAGLSAALEAANQPSTQHSLEGSDEFKAPPVASPNPKPRQPYPLTSNFPSVGETGNLDRRLSGNHDGMLRRTSLTSFVVMMTCPA